MISHRFYKLAGLLTFLLLCRPALSTSVNPSSSPGIPDISSSTTSMTAQYYTSYVTFSIDGFEVQHLYDVPLEQQGSWVSLTTLPDGSLIASDQGGQGSYKIQISGDPDQPSVSVSKLVMPITGTFGMTWAFDHLYANEIGRASCRERVLM